MEPEELATALENAPKANRNLDEAIALIAGYTRIFEGNGKMQWVPPGKSKAGVLPGFTNSIDIARHFAEIIRPKAVTACSWGDEGGKARIEDDQTCFAATPALALCLAAVRAHIENKSEGDTR